MPNHFRRVVVCSSLLLLGCASLLRGQTSPSSPPTQPAPSASFTAPAVGMSSPGRIAIENAPAPLYDDPVGHGASDVAVIWMPGKGDDHNGEWWMYYTQRSATLENARGVDWIHGSAIGIATSKDALHWSYAGVCAGQVTTDDKTRKLADPVNSDSTWWAPSGKKARALPEGAGRVTSCICSSPSCTASSPNGPASGPSSISPAMMG